MKTIFDKTTREDIIHRIQQLNERSVPQWGKMTVYQMMKHCTLWEDMIQGKKRYGRVLAGRLFGKMALKQILKNENVLARHTPTIPELKIKDSGNVSEQKQQWINRIEGYERFSNPDFIHPFFGTMTTSDIGYLVYKHIDHHLRQFNL